MYGMEQPIQIMRTDKFNRDELKSIQYWDWTKEKFESSLEQHIERTKERIEFEKSELERLLKLKETSPEISS